MTIVSGFSKVNEVRQLCYYIISTGWNNLWHLKNVSRINIVSGKTKETVRLYNIDNEDLTDIKNL